MTAFIDATEDISITAVKIALKVYTFRTSETEINPAQLLKPFYITIKKP